MTETKEKYYTIFSMRLAGYLMQQGFVLIGMRPNVNKPDKNVFIFRDSVPLQDSISKYLAQRGTCDI